jgi:adenylosuccinate synthase
VIGGQFGSEGKGKVAAHITISEKIDICVRCGGPNSGHSFLTSSGSRLLLRQIPTGVIHRPTRVLIPAGALIDLNILQQEIAQFELGIDRIGIDRNAMIIESEDIETERLLNMRERLSSTLTGVGSAVSRRALRKEGVRLAKDLREPWIKNLLTDVADECNSALDHGKKVLLEGTQGSGLSLYHSEYYPKATSRDTSAAGFLSEVGLSPLRVTEVVAVFRTFPIRVSGAQAGPLQNEIDWETIQRESGYPTPLAEYTTVSKKLRRVARFDWTMVRRTIDQNRPTRIAIMGLDYLDFMDFGKTSFGELGPISTKFVKRFEDEIGAITYGGTGPGLDEICNDNSVQNRTRELNTVGKI